ncbi:hypothetical protein H8N03_24900 [Ramlibacter sp. USB13]|uniref:Lipoprotein n=1 Tax=Ramlibacter cellulosilyticus TaxID=2764187 RepID=A0A923MVK4_9BURK|nr:hypothetical protein [Ramlibacter cellulosilyticus]MBC5786200.1 hypothetical protein [Ramlibacter cellulosilyticus]
MRSSTIRAAAGGLLVAALLAACGGGDDGNASSSAVWHGTTSTGRDVGGVTLADGSYYLLYSSTTDANTVGGAIQGTATLTGEQFASQDALEFSAEGLGIRPSTLAATLQAGSSFHGTVTTTASGAAVTFQTRTYVAAWGATPMPTLQRLAGAYTGTAGFALGVRPAVFTVTETGAVSSTINGCAITGTATPRTDVNAYDLAIAFGGAPCALPGLAFTGIAYIRPDNGRLYAVARNTPTKQSVIFSGAK